MIRLTGLCRLGSNSRSYGALLAVLMSSGSLAAGQLVKPAAKLIPSPSALGAVHSPPSSAAKPSPSSPAGKIHPDTVVGAVFQPNDASVARAGDSLRAVLRDPFLDPSPPSLQVARAKERSAAKPPGVRGLEVGQLRLQGIVQEEVSHTMIAMVTNGTNLSYFLHPGQRLYDGVVTRITGNELHLHCDGSGPGGKPRDVVLRIGPATQMPR